MQSSWETKLQEIEEIVENNIDKLTYYASPSKGIGGLIWFYAYVYLFRQEASILSRCKSTLANAIESMNDPAYPHYFIHRDIGETGKLLNFMLDRELLEYGEVENLMTDFDNAMLKFLKICIRGKAYDSIVGGIQPAMYLLQRLGSKSNVKGIQIELKELVKSIIAHSIAGKNGHHWEIEFNGKTQVSFDRVHGNCNLINFLFQYQKCDDFADTGLIEVIRSACYFIISNKLKDNGVNALLPTQAGGGYQSLGNATYGDLGIGYTFMEIGNHFGWKDLYDEGLILLNRFNKIQISLNTSIRDANLVYGSSGVSSIFLKAHKQFGVETFNEISNKYLKQTLDFAQHENDLAGYKIYYNTSDEWTNYCLDHGLIGIGLTLIGASISDVGYLTHLNYN